MLKALKANKEYSIGEEQKTAYLEDGFDIYEDGVLIEHSPKKKIEYGKYAALKKELEEAKSNFIEFNTAHETLVIEYQNLKAENDKLKKELEKLKKAGA